MSRSVEDNNLRREPMTTPDPRALLRPGDVATWTETRFVAPDGTGYEFDPHNGPCDCRREQRNVYAGPWLQAGGWVSGGTAPDPGAGCALPMPSRDDLERQAADESTRSEITVTFPPGFTSEQADQWRREWTRRNPIHRLWSELRDSRTGDPDFQTGYDREEHQ